MLRAQRNFDGVLMTYSFIYPWRSLRAWRFHCTSAPPICKSTHSPPLIDCIILQLPQFCKSCFFYLTAKMLRAQRNFDGVLMTYSFIYPWRSLRALRFYSNLLRVFAKRLFKIAAGVSNVFDFFFAETGSLHYLFYGIPKLF